MVIMDHTEGVGSLEEQALKRKERLKNLKRKIPNDDSNDSPSEIVQLPKPKFRSYKPQDESLQEAKIEDAKPVAVEDEVKDLLEAGKEKSKGMPLIKEEVLTLVKLVECNPILNTKSTNATNNRLKEATWVKLTKQFNAAIASHPRTANQLRLKWENLKKNSRKRRSQIYNNSLKVVLQDLDISSLAPRKPDWDLKRDVAKKLEKLERRTQKAIAELIWERLKQGNDDNLGAMVTMTDNRPTEDD